MLNWFTGVVFSLVVISGALVLGYVGYGAPQLPDDLSVRAQSASGGRLYVGGGLPGGK